MFASRARARIGNPECGLLRQRLAESAQERRGIAAPGTAVHTRECRRSGRGESFDHRAPAFRVRVIVQLTAKRFAGSENIRLDERPLASARLGEEVAAEERLGPFFHQKPAFLGVRQMRRIEPAHRVVTDRERLAVGERPGGTIGEVVDRYHRRDLPAQRHRPRRGGEPLVERATFVRLNV